jgi:hypothetical protein
MTKQTKTLLGLAVLAGVGYYAYTQYSKPKAGFANFLSPNCKKNPAQCPCNDGHCPNKLDEGTMPNGQPFEICKNGHICMGAKPSMEFSG